MSDSLRPHEPQHARPPCPSPTPGVYSNSCPLSRWCHPAISSSVFPFSSCPQSFPWRLHIWFRSYQRSSPSTLLKCLTWSIHKFITIWNATYSTYLLPFWASPVRAAFCFVLAVTNWVIHKYLQNEWMDGQTHVFRSWNFSSVHMGPSGFCQTVSLTLGSRLAGARGTGVCVCVCVCVAGRGQARRGRRRQQSSPRRRGRKQICSKVPATDARCGHSDLLWLELRTASSSAPRGPLVPLATELWLSLNGDGLFVTLYRRQGSRPSPRKRNVKRQNGCLRRPYK